MGEERLACFADALYGGVEAAAVLHRGEPFSVARAEDGGWTMSVGLPFATRDEVDLVRLDDEVVVTVGPYRRAILLPDTLRRRPVVGATLLDGALRIAFGSSTR